MTYVDIDVDLWRDGRNINGLLDNANLRANYPYVELAGTKFNRDAVTTTAILKEHFEPDFNNQYPFLVRFHYVFFQTKGDADLFRGLLYIY